MRPQLLDRFGMCVNVTTMIDSDARTQMVLDKLAYEMVRLPQQRIQDVWQSCGLRTIHQIQSGLKLL